VLLSVLGLTGHHNAEGFNSFQSLRRSSPAARASTSTSTSLGAYPKLSNWKILSNGSVVGTVSNHPIIDDGDIITTSPLQNPEIAKSQGMVQTASGTKYKLLDPIKPPTPPSQKSPTLSFFGMGGTKGIVNGETTDGNVNGEEKKKQSGPEWRDAVTKYKLTQSTIGLDDEYLLAGNPVRSTSGKSIIWEAYRAGENGLPTDDPPFCIKVSTNLEAVSREYENYRKLGFLGVARGRFVNCFEFFPVAGYDKRFRNQCALVLGMGARDLKSYLNSRGKLEGKELRDACISATQCVQALHSVGLVWTDLKTENFVVMPNGEVKGIDLESCMPVGDNPVDYSPEACPPEFAEAFLAGDGPYFQLDKTYDIWSLGMLMLELATGRGYFDGKNPAQITKILRDSEEGIILDDIECDERLKDLIRRCLQRNPQKRPNMAQILLHPYFIVSPFSFLQNFN
jgi:hypothetical protein